MQAGFLCPSWRFAADLSLRHSRKLPPWPLPTPGPELPLCECTRGQKPSVAAGSQGHYPHQEARAREHFVSKTTKQRFMPEQARVR